MNIDQDNIFSTDVEALRNEGGRSEAKGELILKLNRSNQKTMTTFKKASFMTAVTALAVVGGITLFQPKTIASTPKTVAEALKKAANYTIKSFILDGNDKKVLQSITSVNGASKSTKFFDENGNEVEGKVMPKISAGQLSGGAFKGIPNDASIQLNMGPAVKALPGNGKKIEIKIVDVNGKSVKKYFVDGKEVKELPGDIKIDVDAFKNEALNSIKIDGSPNGSKFKTIKSQNAIVVLGSKEGKPIVLQSGQTPSEYLVDLLADETKWNIQRGVSFKNEKLDLFSLKNERAPVQLYVDPSSARPRYLIFNGMGFMKPIEDVYEFGATPL
jgi:hypothetical protein